MKFKKLYLKNIRSYEEQEIDFSDGSLLLSGDVGSGKTSILLAIEYALFGRQPGQKGSALLRNNSNIGEVALELEIGDKSVIIERKLKRSSKNVSNDYAAITINGKKIESSITEIKTKILELLNYPAEFIKKNNLLYRYTIYTPQEQMKQIILEEPETRLNILRHVFGMDKYKNIRENLSILCNHLKEENKILQIELKGLEQDKSQLLSIIEITKILEEKIKEKLSELQEHIKKRKEIESESAYLDSQIKEKERLEKEVEKTQILLSTKKQNFFSISQEEQEIKNTMLEVEESLSEVEYSSLISQINSAKEKIESLASLQTEAIAKMNFIQKNEQELIEKRERIFKIDICPTCLQDVPEFHKLNILNEAEKKIAEIKNILFSLKDISEALPAQIKKEKTNLNELEKQKTYQEILKSKKEHVQKSRLKLSRLEKQKQEMEKDCTLLENHIAELKQGIFKLSKFETLSRMKNNELKSSLLAEKNLEISIAELKKELEMTNKEISNLTKIIKQKEETQKKLSNILELNDWLSNQFLGLVTFTEKNVLVNLRREFSEIFNKWFQMLTPSESFQAHLDESFTPLVLQNEIEMDYSFLSGGERTAIALAYRLALNQIINSVLSKIKTKDIVILDEPTDGFSEFQLDKMRDVLEELNAKQLIIVSHEQKMEGFVENIIRIRKSTNSSNIESPQPLSPEIG